MRVLLAAVATGREDQGHRERPNYQDSCQPSRPHQPLTTDSGQYARA